MSNSAGFESWYIPLPHRILMKSAQIIISELVFTKFIDPETFCNRYPWQKSAAKDLVIFGRRGECRIRHALVRQYPHRLELHRVCVHQHSKIWSFYISNYDDVQRVKENALEATIRIGSCGWMNDMCRRRLPYPKGQKRGDDSSDEYISSIYKRLRGGIGKLRKPNSCKFGSCKDTCGIDIEVANKIGLRER